MSDEIGLFEAIHTQRALRYIKPDAIPDALVRRVLDAGMRALLPLGYPAEGHRYGPTNRRPVEEVTFGERWGQRWDAGGALSEHA